MSRSSLLQLVLDWTEDCVAMATGSGREVSVGDQFVKTAQPNLAWTVKRIYYPDGNIPHVVIEQSGIYAQQAVIALSALLDRSIFRRSENAGLAGDWMAGEEADRAPVARYH